LLRGEAGLSKSVQKGEEIGLLLRGKADTEALVVELDDVAQRGGRAVVEIGRARRKTAQDGSFDFPDIGAFAGDHGTADIGDLEVPAGQWAGGALNPEYRQSRDIEARRAQRPGIGDADVERRLHRVVA